MKLQIGEQKRNVLKWGGISGIIGLTSMIMSAPPYCSLLVIGPISDTKSLLLQALLLSNKYYFIASNHAVLPLLSSSSLAGK